MGWSVGYDSNWDRDIGYGVPAICDHPTCETKIDRGLAYVCGGEPFGGEYGCGLFFCSEHRYWWVQDQEDDESADAELCGRCALDQPPFKPKPDLEEWTHHKMTDPSWARWREENGLS